MATNFEHMKKWSSIYQKLTFIENMLVDGDSTEVCLQFMSGARGALDIMLKELVKEAQISDDQIIMIKRGMASGSKDTGTVDLFGRILALEKMDIITHETAENMHFIRKYGNKAVHGEGDFIEMDQPSMYRLAVQMYEKLYRETYLFANQYVPEQRTGSKDRKSGTAGSQTGQNSAGSVRGAIFATILIIGAVLLFLAIGSSM